MNKLQKFHLPKAIKLWGGANNPLRVLAQPLFRWMEFFSKYMDLRIGSLGCLWIRKAIYKHVFCVDISDNNVMRDYARNYRRTLTVTYGNEYVV